MAGSVEMLATMDLFARYAQIIDLMAAMMRILSG
jgi:hypothetical protein